MTLLPGTNYLSDSARTEAEMKVALDKVNEVIAEIGSKDVTTLTITAAGAILTPLSSMVSVMPEGAGVADTLSSIGVSNIDKGRMVILQHAEEPLLAANGITITHGITATAIEMLDGANFVLCAKRKICLIYTGATGHWKEVWRGYGRETESERAAERTDMGLGTASVETIAANFGSNSIGKVLKVGAVALAENDVLKIGVGGLIEAATISDNATTLGDQPASSFVRSNENQAQSIDNNLSLTSAGSTILNTVSTGAAHFPGLRIHSGASLATAVERGQLYSSTADGSLTLRTLTAGGVVDPGITLIPSTTGAGATPGRIEFKANAASAAQSLTPGAGNGLNADLLDGHEWAEIPPLVTTGYRRTHLKSATQNNLGYWNNPSQPQNEYGEPLVDMMNIEYPITPNGVRRFTVNASVCFKATSTDTSGRDARFGIWTHQIGDNIRYPNNANWVNYFFFNQIANPQSSTYYTAVAVERNVTPAVGDVISVLAGENELRHTAAMADVGHGSLSTPVGGSTTNSSIRGRTFVQITYLDEG